LYGGLVPPAEKRDGDAGLENAKARFTRKRLLIFDFMNKKRISGVVQDI